MADKRPGKPGKQNSPCILEADPECRCEHDKGKTEFFYDVIDQKTEKGCIERFVEAEEKHNHDAENKAGMSVIIYRMVYPVLCSEEKGKSKE
jgi:hypothetical protein